MVYTYISDKMLKTLQLQKPYSVEHSPTLNTVLMVEETLRDAKEVLTVAELKRRLPKKAMHSTLVQVLDYLHASGKIFIGTKGIVWIFKPQADIEKLIKEGIEL